MPTQIHNARILTPFAQVDGSVLIAGDRIVDVGRSITTPRNTETIDAQRMFLVPGFIDVHMHGGAGRHIMEGTPQAIIAACNAHVWEGTTTLLPTTKLGPVDTMITAIEAVKEAQSLACDGTIAGAHVISPFLSPTYVPAELRKHLLTPGETDWRAYLKRWPHVRMVGMSPELPGVFQVSDALRSEGVLASIAYSNASYDLVMHAAGHGFGDVMDIFTNTSFQQRPEAFRVPGLTESALAMDELGVQLGAAGQRLPLIILQIVYRCKGAENIVLTSDAQGMPGEGGNTATVAVLVRDMVTAGVSLRVALRMATVNPARRIGLDQTKGRISIGYDADLLLLDEALNVRFCMAKGRILRNELE